MTKFTYRSLLTTPFFLGLTLGITATAVGAGTLGSSVFSDVPRGSYYDAAVGNMYGRGIIRGYEDGNFHPDDYVTRAQVAVMFDRFISAQGGVTVSSSTSSSRRSSSAASSDASSSSTSSSSSSSSFKYETPGEQGAVHFKQSTFTIGEASKKIELYVFRDKGTQGDVTVKYKTVPVSAAAPANFLETSGTLSFRHGDTSKTFSVGIIDDKVASPNLTFKVVLESPTGGLVVSAPHEATIMILDNDGGGGAYSSGASSAGSSVSAGAAGALVFSASDYGVWENGGTATVTVSRIGGTAGAVAVNYATSPSDGSTVAGQHYNNVNGTLNFGAGETSKSFTVSAIDNSATDGDKVVKLRLSSPTGGVVLGSIQEANLKIVDNESLASGSGSFTIVNSAEFSVYAQTDSEVRFSIRRSTESLGTTSSVVYGTTNISAIAGTDYTAVSGTLTFAPGELVKTVSVPLIKRTHTSTAEFNFSISNPSGGASLGSRTYAKVNIQ